MLCWVYVGVWFVLIVVGVFVLVVVCVMWFVCVWWCWYDVDVLVVMCDDSICFFVCCGMFVVFGFVIGFVFMGIVIVFVGFCSLWC